jgi:alpha-mannosidase II
LDDERRKFIWAEISFFKMWWQEQKEDMKDNARKLAVSGRLEFVTGGWTMTDEASPHLNEILHSMTEGHIWLMDNLGVKPTVGWAIDPFGHSSVIPYLASLLQLDAIVINRVHKETKELFRKDKNLEFIWRQNWEIQPDTQG